MSKQFSKNKIYRKGLAEKVDSIDINSYKPYAKKGHETHITRLKNFSIADYPEDKEVYRFCISSETVDHDNDIVIQKGIGYENYIKNPVLFWGHDWYSVPIGKVVAVTLDETEKKTYADIILGSTPKAQEIETLIKEGIVQATSIGFYVKDWDYDEDIESYLLKEVELLELSLVGLPANPDAVRSEEKELELETGEKVIKEIAEEKSLTEEQIREIVTETVAAALAESAEESEDEEQPEKDEETEETTPEEVDIAEQLATLTTLIEGVLQNINGEDGDGDNSEDEDPEPEEDTSEEDSGSEDSDGADNDDDSAPVIILAD